MVDLVAHHHSESPKLLAFKISRNTEWVSSRKTEEVSD